jgi:N-acetylneuraminate synthase/N,N'-diacetyllegionaminate synthase
MAAMSEIDDAVRAFYGAGGRDLILLHCVSSYPAPHETVHLRAMNALSTVYRCPVGFSDHTEGAVAAIAAAVLGASIVEKHFTLDKNLPGPDHRFSSDPSELKCLVNSIRQAAKCMAPSPFIFSPEELRGRRDFRLSCVAAGDRPSGHRLSENDIVFRRPGTGFAPKESVFLIRRTLLRPVAAGQVFCLEDFA